MVTCDGAGASHALVKELDRLAARHGYQLVYSVGWELGDAGEDRDRQGPRGAWRPPIDGKGKVRERRADDACGTCAARTAGAGSRKRTSPS